MIADVSVSACRNHIAKKLCPPSSHDTKPIESCLGSPIESNTVKKLYEAFSSEKMGLKRQLLMRIIMSPICERLTTIQRA